MTAPVDIGTLIVSTPGVAGGRPRVRGTGISVDQIAALWLGGLSPERIVSEKYPLLTAAQVYAAIAYYHANRDAVDKSLAANSRAYDEWSAQSE